MEKLPKERITRKEQKEKTKAGLIESAEGLFARAGIGQTTTADIAKALQVSHGTVFIHFPTREDLVMAVVERFGERLSAELGRRCHVDLSLKELLKAHVSVLSEFEDFYLRLISESQSLPPQIRSVLYAMNASLSYRLHRAAKELMKEGEIKKFDQAPLFNAWLGLLHYHIQNRDLFSDKTPILKHMGDELIRQFLFLIKT
jgi:TetR/AcrR family transcriptional regulator, acrEF/envCD operon repressor